MNIPFGRVYTYLKSVGEVTFADTDDWCSSSTYTSIIIYDHFSKYLNVNQCIHIYASMCIFKCIYCMYSTLYTEVGDAYTYADGPCAL